MTKTEAVVFLQRLRCVGMEVEGAAGKPDTGYRFDIMALYTPDEASPLTIDEFNNTLHMALLSLGNRAARE